MSKELAERVLKIVQELDNLAHKAEEEVNNPVVDMQYSALKTAIAQLNFFPQDKVALMAIIAQIDAGNEKFIIEPPEPNAALNRGDIAVLYHAGSQRSYEVCVLEEVKRS